MPAGGGKSGVWVLSEDGSGTWTRFDASAVRFRQIYGSGPARQEITSRVTVDANSGETLGVMDDYPTNRKLDDWLPEPSPRAIRTIFSFDSTKARVPPNASSSGTCEQEGGASPAGSVRSVTDTQPLRPSAKEPPKRRPWSELTRSQRRRRRIALMMAARG